MASLHRSLNDQVNWSRCLDALDIEIGMGALPWKMSCPFCPRGRLSILTDKLAGGQWHWCPDCGARGDMIEFASRILQRPIHETVRQLCVWGLMEATDNQIKHYIYEYVDYRKEVTAFWENSRAFSPADLEKVKLQAHYTALGNWGGSDSRWATDGPNRFYGVCHMNDAAIAIRKPSWTKSFRPPDKKFAGVGPGQKCSWGYALVFPFYDLPGRISAFLFVGGEGRNEKDFVFKRVQTESPSRPPGMPHPREAGLNIDLASIEDSIAEHGHKLVVIKGADVAARLHLRHLADSTLPMPIVGWQPGPEHNTNTSWDMFVEAEKIYWAPNLDPVVVREAARTDSQVSTVGSTVRGVRHYLKDYSEKVVDICLRNHQHWTKAIHEHLSDLTPQEVQNKLLELYLPTDLADHLIRTLPTPMRDYAEQVLGRKVRFKQLIVNKTTVVERQSGWYAARTTGDELIMNGCLRILKVVTHKRTRRLFYEGCILMGQDRLDFCVPKEVLDNKPMSWLQDKVAETGEFFLTVNKSWDRHLLSIAMQMHPPQSVVGMDTVGWNAEEERFDFPPYSIGAGGLVIRNNTEYLAEDIPCRNWPEEDEPEPVTGRALTPIAVLKQPARSVTWALITAVVANVLAPVFREKTVGIGLTGLGAKVAGETLAKYLGCVEYYIKGLDEVRANISRKALDAEQVHGWPLYIGYGDADTNLHRWVYPPGEPHFEHNAIVPLSWYYANVLRMFEGWLIIDCPERASVGPMAGHAARNFIPAYLADLSARRFVLAETEDISWFGCIHNDIVEFADTHGATRWDVERARDIVTPSCGMDGRPELFVKIVAQMVKHERLTLLTTDKTVAVPKTQFKKVLRSHSAQLRDTLDVSELLQSAGVLLGDDSTWEVDKAWWSAQLAQFKPQTKTILKLYG